MSAVGPVAQRDPESGFEANDPLKMVARLQAEASHGGPYLLLPLRASGHSGGATRSSLVDQDVDELAFHCWALDLSDPTGSTDRRDSPRRAR